MSQKSRFKMQTQGITTHRKTFPQLPYGTLQNPKFIQTAHGYVRHLSAHRPTAKLLNLRTETVSSLTAGGHGPVSLTTSRTGS